MQTDAATRAALEAAIAGEHRSDVNRNPRDTHEHPNGVWTLPPDLAAPEGERDRYREIGESDRLTLRFVKPE